MTVQIVTDSTADIPQAQELGITIVPLTVFFGEEAYLDGVELDNASFYKKLQASKVSPRTSQPPPASFQEAYKRLLDEGAAGILSVHLSAKLSGTYQAACTGRDTLPDALQSAPLEIIDSKTVSLGMGLAVMRAAEEARQGLGLAEIKAHLVDQLSRTRILFVLDTLEYLKRGGRIGGAKALLGNLLSVKPILSLKNGGIVPVEQPRTRSKAYGRIAQMLGEMPEPEELAVVESDTEVGQHLVQAIKEVYPKLGAVPTYKLGAVVGTYAGPGTAGAVFVSAREG